MSIRGTLIRPETDEFAGFWTWLGVSSSKFKIVGALAVIAPVLAVIYYCTGILKNADVKIHLPNIDVNMLVRYSYITQIGVIFLLLLLHTTIRPTEYEPKYAIGLEGQRGIRFWWGIALLSFLLLYIFLWLDNQLQYSQQHLHLDIPSFVFAVIKITRNLCNNFSTIAFLMCFAVLAEPGKSGPGKHNWVTFWAGCLVMLTFIEAVLRLNSPLDPTHRGTDWFDLLTGASAGIALAMFCGRLASPLLGAPLSVIAPLYLYALLQTSYGNWDSDPQLALLAANLCLLLKCYLSLVVAWLLVTKNLLLFMERGNRIRSQLDVWRSELRTQRIVEIPQRTDRL